MGVHSAASFLILVTGVSSRLKASPWVKSHICQQFEANSVHLHGKFGGVEGTHGGLKKKQRIHVVFEEILPPLLW